MLRKKTSEIVADSRSRGWVLEPDAKEVLAFAGLDIPKSIHTDDTDAACQFLRDLGGPVVAKAVSGQILHKTEHQAVVTNITNPEVLKSEMARLLDLPGCGRVLVEEMITGIEIIVGAKNDYQFGPVIVFGIGGTGVEVYNDTAIRMAPLKPGDVFSMAESLVAGELIKGYRGKPGVNMEILVHLMVNFSYLVMDLDTNMESIDLNPVICTPDRCVVADARIMLLDDPNTSGH